MRAFYSDQICVITYFRFIANRGKSSFVEKWLLAPGRIEVCRDLLAWPESAVCFVTLYPVMFFIKIYSWQKSILNVNACWHQLCFWTDSEAVTGSWAQPVPHFGTIWAVYLFTNTGEWITEIWRVLPMEEHTFRQRNVFYCSVSVRKEAAHYCLVTGKTLLLSVLSSSALGFLHWVVTDVLGRPGSDMLTQVWLLKRLCSSSSSFTPLRVSPSVGVGSLSAVWAVPLLPCLTPETGGNKCLQQASCTQQIACHSLAVVLLGMVGVFPENGKIWLLWLLEAE